MEDKLRLYLTNVEQATHFQLQPNGTALQSILAGGRFLHHVGVDPVTMRSRLEDDPRKNDGLVRFRVDQTRERYLTFDVEALADAPDR